MSEQNVNQQDIGNRQQQRNHPGQGNFGEALGGGQQNKGYGDFGQDFGQEGNPQYRQEGSMMGDIDSRETSQNRGDQGYANQRRAGQWPD